MLDSKILDRYIKEFYGYGNWKGKFWFIGIEEGGGNSKDEIQRRLDSWLRFQTDLIDNKEHSKYIGGEVVNFLEAIPPRKSIKLQSTWRKLIRLKLSYEGKNIDNDLIRNLQGNSWGRLNSDNVVTNLFPLASPEASKWKYNEWTDLNYLQNRDLYHSEIEDVRISYLNSKIKNCKPDIVILYSGSKSMMRYWNRLIGVNDLSKSCELFEMNDREIRVLRRDKTVFVQTPHPTNVYPNEFWNKTGKIIREFSKLISQPKN